MAKAAVLKTAVARATSGFESLALRCRPAPTAAGATTLERWPRG